MVNDYSKCTWTHLLSSKTNAFQVIKAFVLLVENQFNTTIKTIRSYNKLELTNAKTSLFFGSNRIFHQRTGPYITQQNTVVQRKHKYLLQTAKALLFQFKLSLRYWGEYILCSTYIINRLFSTSLKN